MKISHEHRKELEDIVLNTWFFCGNIMEAVKEYCQDFEIELDDNLKLYLLKFLDNSINETKTELKNGS